MNDELLQLIKTANNAATVADAQAKRTAKEHAEELQEVHQTLDDVKTMLVNVARHTRSTPDEWVSIMGQTEENMRECVKPMTVTTDINKLKLDWISEFAKTVDTDVFSTDSITQLRKTFRKARDCFTGS